MKVKHEGVIYNLQWPKQFDLIVKRVAKEYKSAKGYVQWKKADEEGALKGLPKHLTYRDLSHRYTFLKFRRTQKYRDRIFNQTKAQQEKKYENSKSKLEIFRNAPENIKKKRGWKAKEIWSIEQKKILEKLAKKYRKSKITVDWGRLVNDPQIEKLPYQNRFKLMKYYGQCIKRESNEKLLEKKREDALRYKKEHYKAYRESQRKRNKIVKKTVNEILLKKVELR